MPSSTSNFRRPIPTANWTRVWALTGSLLVLSVFAWEIYWRSEGYTPQYSDSADIWASNRHLVGKGDGKQTVIIGASRVRFDLDLDVWESSTGKRPIVLGMNGSSAWPLLKDLAGQEDFRGTVVCGVTEGLFFLPGFAGPARQAIANVKYARNWNPSQQVAFAISKQLEPRFALLNGWDLNLNAVIARWTRFENREGAVVVPDLPPLFQDNLLDGREVLWETVTAESELGKRIQQIWIPLFSFGPPLGGPPLDELVQGIRADVERIRSRGGNVVFVRLPSTSDLLALEKQRWPRPAYWDRLIAETGVSGVHYEDYEELSGYDCPEWSHLTPGDAKTFTASLVEILAGIGASG